MSLWTEREIKWVLENRWKQLCRNVEGSSPEVDWMGVQREVEVGLGRRMRREMQVEPLILCLVQPAPGGTPVYKGRADAEPDTRPSSRGRGGRHGGPGRDSGNGHVRRDRNAAPARVVPSRVIGTPAPAAAGSAPAAATPAPAPAPAKEPVAAAVVVTSAPEPEMPAGRTRRRRSAAA
jgi:ribonuclease J